MILFKRQSSYPDIEREYAQCDVRVKEVIAFMELVSYQLWRDDLVIVRVAERDQVGPGKTHYEQFVEFQKNSTPYRHIDIALLESDRTLKNRPHSELLRNIVNQVFAPFYPFKGMFVIPPLDHAGTAPHFHVQVSRRVADGRQEA